MYVECMDGPFVFTTILCVDRYEEASQQFSRSTSVLAVKDKDGQSKGGSGYVYIYIYIHLLYIHLLNIRIVLLMSVTKQPPYQHSNHTHKYRN